MAVAHLISSPRLFYRYWRMSFVDFVASQVGFWVTLFTSTEIGLAASVGFSVAYMLLRLTFPRWLGLSHMDAASTQRSLPDWRRAPGDANVPAGIYLVRFTDGVFFANAERIKSAIVEAVRVRYEPAAVDVSGAPDRLWNSHAARRVARVRRRRGMTAARADEGPLRHVVLDFGMVTFVDVTGVLALMELKAELRRHAGAGLQFRFVGLAEGVRERLARSQWPLAEAGEPRTDEADVVYPTLGMALHHEGGDEGVGEKLDA